MPHEDPRIRVILDRHREKASDPRAEDAAWRELVDGPLADRALSFDAHWDAYRAVFAERGADTPPAPAYQPTKERVDRAHVTRLMRDVGVDSYSALHRWSALNRDAFWALALRDLAWPFIERPASVRGVDADAEHPAWLEGARMNAVDACFRADDAKTAIVLGGEGDADVAHITYGDLARLTNRVAHGLRDAGIRPGDAVALYMPMTVECVAAYLGVVKAGCAVVSIADSFAPPEVLTRLRVGDAKAVVTTSAFTRGGKTIDLYAKVREADAPRAIVLVPSGDAPALRAGDVTWDDFLGADADFKTHAAHPYDVTNVLFSSGTTGDPKAIPWTHLTPIKAAADARYHQDVHEDDVVAWPTSIGWMMGPWVIYAALANRATLALYEGAPNTTGFTRFVQDAGVTVLGVVPALVRAWRSQRLLDGVDWSRIRVFSSTGEASNVEDYVWLMHLAGYRAPVIEYCGGTEIGGGHLTGTVVQPQSPATFSTPALGLDFVILSEDGREVGVGEMGEIFLVPPSIGLSERLLNRDHHDEYYAGAPKGPQGETLRRHGDEVEKMPGGYFRAHGRADDTMNLGGIKVSSLELERVMDRHPGVYQSAAVAVQPEGGGADSLVVFVVPADAAAPPERDALRRELAGLIKKDLNPLFRVTDVVLVDALPRTASNKIMRRELRKQYRGP